MATATRPSRTPAAKATTAKPAATATAPAEPVVAPAAEEPTAATAPEATENRTVIVLVDDGTTKRYRRWVAPEDSGLTGSLYTPMDVTEVRVAVIR